MKSKTAHTAVTALVILARLKEDAVAEIDSNPIWVREIASYLQKSAKKKKERGDKTFS